MEKRSQRMNKMASKSNVRRTEWISDTLDGLQNDLKAGVKRNLVQA